MLMKNYSNTLLRHLFVTMLRIRLCEESLVDPINNGIVRCPVHLCSGQEAIAAGVCAALKKNDFVFGNHRSHGHYLAMGGDMASMMAEIYGKKSGCSKGRGGSMHIVDTSCGFAGAAPIVGGTISLAVGAALSLKIHKQDNLAVSFFGDGATGEGVLFEALNFAALSKLPLIFVCENNLYSTHMPITDCRPNEDIYRVAEPFGIISFQLNGNDVLEVYDTALKSIELCKNGKGPVFIECRTYRLRGHVGPNDNIQGKHTDIRPNDEIEFWKKKDPLLYFEKWLLKNSVFDSGTIEALKRDAEKDVRGAHKFAMENSFPEQEGLGKYVFK